MKQGDTSLVNTEGGKPYLMEPLLDIKDAAELLNVSEMTIRRCVIIGDVLPIIGLYAMQNSYRVA